MCAASVGKINTKVNYQPQGQLIKLDTVKDSKTDVRQSKSGNSSERCYSYRKGGAT